MQFILAALAMQMPYYHHLEKRCGVAGVRESRGVRAVDTAIGPTPTNNVLLALRADPGYALVHPGAAEILDRALQSWQEYVLESLEANLWRQSRFVRGSIPLVRLGRTLTADVKSGSFLPSGTSQIRGHSL